LLGAIQFRFRRQLKRPRDYESNRETNHNQHYHQPDCPVWKLEEWENLGSDLNQQQPGHEAVRNRNFTNLAPLQLGEKVFWVHCARLDEALVTAALYFDTRDLKSACNLQNDQ